MSRWVGRKFSIAKQRHFHIIDGLMIRLIEDVMEEKPKPYQEYKVQYDYFRSIILALLGTIPGLAIWIYAASKGVFFFHVLALIALGVFLGARFRQPQKQLNSLIIALLICVLAMIAGDVIESTLLYGRVLDSSGYIGVLMEKYKGFRILQYLITLVLPIFFEVGLRRAQARGESW
jgi:hypothetical protein